MKEKDKKEAKKNRPSHTPNFLSKSFYPHFPKAQAAGSSTGRNSIF
jgi:hypothetical protein